MTSVSPSDLKTSLGALILGGMVSMGCVTSSTMHSTLEISHHANAGRLSGVVGMQTSLYFRMFSKDRWPTKLKVRG